MDRLSKRRVLVIDDHPIVRAGLAKLVNQEQDLEICGEAEDGAEGLRLITSLAPDLVLLDLSLRGRNGLEVLKDIRYHRPSLPVLVVSMHEERLYAERVLRAGARGYVNKEEATRTVIGAIRRVLSGEVYSSPELGSRLVARLAGAGQDVASTPVDTLTDRELEVLRLIGRGFDTRQIAGQLYRSGKTVEAHRSNLKRKLSIGSSSELLRFAIAWVHQTGTGDTVGSLQPGALAARRTGYAAPSETSPEEKLRGPD